MIYDICIIGAGASGLMASYFTSQIAKSITLAIVDKSKVIGYKLRIAGGGKANITNKNISIDDYICQNNNFLRSCLNAWTSKNCLDFLDKINFSYEERKLGQIFGLEPASNLIEKINNHTADYYLESIIENITKNEDIFQIKLFGKTIQANNLIIACGSPAYVNDNNSIYSIISKLGHKIAPFKPALVPLIMPNDWIFKGLEGVSLNVKISYNNISFTDDLLFTHKGISGPATLKMSCYWEKNESISINFLPEISVLEELNKQENAKLLVKNLLQKFINKRLSSKLVPMDILENKVAQLSKNSRITLNNLIHNYTFVPVNNEGMKKAEVAKGGIDINSINPKTFESKTLSNLYFTGEIIDVIGILGGYNLHFAFASAKLAIDNILKQTR